MITSMGAVQFTIEELAIVCRAKIVQRSEKHNSINDIAVDSRHLNGNSETVFIALIGKRHNGHLFLEEAVEKGCRIFIVSEPPSDSFLSNDISILQCDDTLKALQLLASAHRRKFSIPIVSVTGSNGKTMVKEWLSQLLSMKYNVLRSPKSYNSQVGVPLSVSKLSNDYDIAVFEAGISQVGEMSHLESIIKPDSGIFTNIGAAHDENFINQRQKVAEKLLLFVGCKKLVFCTDHHEIQQTIISSGLGRKIDLFSWGRQSDARLRIIHMIADDQGTTVTAEYEGQSLTVVLPYQDHASVENMMHCWAFMLSEGFSNHEIAAGLKKLTPVEMRLELKEGINRCTIINDSYNSDINSLSIAIDFLEKNRQYQKKTIILSDILQSGKKGDILAQEIGQMISLRGIDQFIGIGPVLFASRNRFGEKAIFYRSTSDFLNHHDLASFENEMILLKGARAFEFEKISKLLEEKAHETILETDLQALTHNLNLLRSKLNPNTKMMAMVKAFAYGSGAVEIARHLEYHRIDYLAVAYADEGVMLRKAGISLPVMVMSPEESSMYFMIRYQLEPEVYNLKTLQQLLAAMNEYAKDPSPIGVHIKLDTGMHRLGFADNDIEPLIAEILNTGGLLKVKSVFSHFSASDDSAYDEFTRNQIQLFEKMSKRLSAGLGYPIMKHIANTAAILRFPESQFDMVRTGIGLYGADPTGSEDSDFKQVATLRTKVIQIRNIEAGESVGYNRKAINSQPRKIATLAAGYADGLSRRLGNGNWNVSINGHLAPLIGDICMDMCMADITGLDGISEGDEVQIFGPERPLYQYALAMSTIPYEALTSVSARVKRIYIQRD